jgi:hypothetical protein
MFVWDPWRHLIDMSIDWILGSWLAARRIDQMTIFFRIDYSWTIVCFRPWMTFNRRLLNWKNENLTCCDVTNLGRLKCRDSQKQQWTIWSIASVQLKSRHHRHKSLPKVRNSRCQIIPDHMLKLRRTHISEDLRTYVTQPENGHAVANSSQIRIFLGFSLPKQLSQSKLSNPVADEKTKLTICR